MRSRNVTNNELQDMLIDIFPELKGHLRVSINGESYVLSEASVMLGLPKNHLSNKYKQLGLRKSHLSSKYKKLDRDLVKLQEYVDAGEFKELNMEIVYQRLR